MAKKPTSLSAGAKLSTFTSTTARLFWKAKSGLAAIEFALIAGFLAVAILNVADIAVYFFDELQVNNATQMGAQAAWATCDLNHIPATTKCGGMSAAITAAVQSTALGTSVTQQSGSPAEGYYCISSGGTLQYMAAYSSPPADCSAAGNTTVGPGDYIKVQTTYTYAPIFPGLSVAGVFPATITATSYVRLT